MHEASLVQGLLKIVLDACKQHNDENADKQILKVKKIECEAGLLACFENFALIDCFDIFAENTICESAKLVINTAMLDCICNKCGKNFSINEKKFVCPFCGSIEISFNDGNGLIIKKLDVEIQGNTKNLSE